MNLATSSGLRGTECLSFDMLRDFSTSLIWAAHSELVYRAVIVGGIESFAVE